MLNTTTHDSFILLLNSGYILANPDDLPEIKKWKWEMK